jgi:hypothetical protein
MKKIALLVFAAIGLSGCTSTAYHREAPKNQPHALVLFEKTKGLEYALTARQIVYPLEINGLPINNFARWDLVDFRIPVGPTKLLVTASVDRGVEGIGFLKFDAQDGEVYSVTAKSLDESFMISVRNKAGDKITHTDARKALSAPNNPAYIPIIIPVR